MQAIGYVKCVDTEGDKRLTDGRIYYVYSIDPQGGQFLIMSNNYFEWHNTGRFAPATKDEYSDWIVDKNEKEKTPQP
jgi:hypothetical protein